MKVLWGVRERIRGRGCIVRRIYRQAGTIPVMWLEQPVEARNEAHAKQLARDLYGLKCGGRKKKRRS